MILRIGSLFMSVMVSGTTIALPVVAQGSPPYQIYREPAEVVSVNRDRLIQGSKFGKALIDVLTSANNDWLKKMHPWPRI
ncbi:MAG: hypothetical protein P8I79_02475 [Amylibacter sp.]|nr:hypothetical protein [Amylibacter sp.]